MSILSAKFANAESSAVNLVTQEAGAVAIQREGPDVSGGWRAAYDAWTGITSEFEAPAINYIAKAESHIASHFSTVRLLQLKVWWDSFPHDLTPKLATVFGWADGVTRLAVAGSSEFEAPPFSFVEIVGEVMGIPREEN